MKIYFYLLLFASASASTGCKNENQSTSTIAGRSMLRENNPDISEKDAANRMAGAVLFAKSGSAASGTVSFFDLNGALKVMAKVGGVTPAGTHGIHIHETGDCTAEDASTAGGHFNPTKQNHGAPNSRSGHVGDLGNIEIDQNGRGEMQLVLEDAYYDQESFGGWKAIIGKTVVMHDGADDLHSQPSGNSGARIACGVVEEAKPIKTF